MIGGGVGKLKSGLKNFIFCDFQVVRLCMRFRLLYLLFIWLTTAIVGSWIYILSSLIVNPSAVIFESKVFETFLFVFMMTLLFSIPSVILFGVACYFLCRTLVSTPAIKVVLAVLATVLCYLSYILMGATSAALVMTVPCFIIPLVGSIFYFKLRD